MVKCACGCGKDIKPNKRYTHYKQRYIYGHQNKNKVKKIPIVCEYCGITNYYRPVDGKGRRFCSRECYWKWLKGKSQTKVSLQGRRNISNAKQGNKNPSWKGGITPLTRKIRECNKNKSWIKSVFCRDDYICQNCSTRGGALEAHHKKEFYIIMKDFLEENRQLCALKDKEVLFELALSYNSFWDVDNGETLCSDCHKRGKEEQYV